MCNDYHYYFGKQYYYTMPLSKKIQSGILKMILIENNAAIIHLRLSFSTKVHLNPICHG